MWISLSEWGADRVRGGQKCSHCMEKVDAVITAVIMFYFFVEECVLLCDCACSWCVCEGGGAWRNGRNSDAVFLKECDAFKCSSVLFVLAGGAEKGAPTRVFVTKSSS